jgi:hypothetical protein
MTTSPGVARRPRGGGAGSFLYTGKRARVGQRVETVVHMRDGRRSEDPTPADDRPHHDGTNSGDTISCNGLLPCRLSGVVTAVGGLPSFEEWVVNQGLTRRIPKCDRCGLSPFPIQVPPRVPIYFPGSCPRPDCLTNRISPTGDAPGRQGGRPYTLEDCMRRCYEMHGTVQGQQIVSYSILHPDFEPMQDRLPFRRGRIYRVRYTAEDAMIHKWCVTSIEDVGDGKEPPNDLPKEFLM